MNEGVSETGGSEKMRAILILSPGLPGLEGVVSALRGLGEIHGVETVEDALAALRTGRYEVVLTAPGELFSLARAEARQRGELILDKLGQAVCIVNRAGSLVWANPRLAAYPLEVVDAIRKHCAEICQELAKERPPEQGITSRRRTIRVGPEYFFDLTVSPLLAPGRNVEEVVGLAFDISAAQRLQERMDTIDAAGRELVQLDAEAFAQLDVGERLRVLEEKINRYAHDLLDFDHFVVRVLDQQTRRLETVIASGLSEEVRMMPLLASTEGNGISGYVAATGRSHICPDVTKDPLYLPGLERAGSSLTVPLYLREQVVGVFNVEAHETSAFMEEDRRFAEIFARYIAIALHILKLLAVERSTTTGQITADVASELGAPLNDIVAETTGLINEYIGQDDLRRRLRTIIHNVDRLKGSLTAITQTRGVRGLIPETRAADPLLSGRRILVADDEEIIRETISDVLAKSGALSVTARDGVEAVGMIQAQHFDLIVSDIKMPYKNGYEVFAAARIINPDCPVILITGFGYDPDHSIVRASREGLAGVLFKPFKIDQLLEQIRRALSKQAPAPP
jgi:CheY-like chemotaxis protein